MAAYNGSYFTGGSIARGSEVNRQLTILASPQIVVDESSDETTLAVEEIRAWGVVGIATSLGKFSHVRYLISDLGFIHYPLKISLVMRFLSRGECVFEDVRGQSRRVTLPFLLRAALIFFAEGIQQPFFLRKIRKEVRTLSRDGGSSEPVPLPTQISDPPLYLRTDLTLDTRAGGAIAHTAGVLNELLEQTGVVFVTTSPIPTVRHEIESYIVKPARRFWHFRDLPSLYFNLTLEQRLPNLMHDRPISFVYQRYNSGNFSGLKFARARRIPFVLEFNGSEVWVGRNWGTPMAHEDLALDIEDLNLRGASLVVVVSQALADEVQTRGVPPERILVNPNGVDPSRFGPHVDGEPLRRRLGLDGKIVIGFIGSFGRWHGPEVLVDGFAEAVARNPTWRDRYRLLLVGDGVSMPGVKAAIRRHRLDDQTVLTGLVDQQQGPAHLAACDVLCSPHVPNPDGSPFFGSPTKLFEYMAMGKPIVASDLDQIGQILRHEDTALLVPPADPEALARAFERLEEDPSLRSRLGMNARVRVLEAHTWEKHVDLILERVRG